jgi:hypothetical protein
MNDNQVNSTEEVVDLFPEEMTGQPQNGSSQEVPEHAAESAQSEESQTSKEKTSQKTTGKYDAQAGFKDAWKQVENLGQTVSDALQGRANVVMMRINDEALQYLDMLVEAEVVKSRSEAAAFLINEGINANQNLFNKIGDVTNQIAELRKQLRDTVQHFKEE